MITDGERKSKKAAVSAVAGIVVFAAVGFVVGFNIGQSRQLKEDSTGNLALSLHYLSLLEATNLEKLDRDLRFSVYANVDMQNRLGGLATNEMDPKELARVSAIHSEMSTQVVSLTPDQLITNLSGK